LRTNRHTDTDTSTYNKGRLKLAAREPITLVLDTLFNEMLDRPNRLARFY